MSDLSTGATPIPDDYVESGAYDRDAKRWAREGRAKCEAKWKAEGKIFTWFRDEPDWAPECEAVTPYWEEKPPLKEPGRIIRRFSLIGDGQVATTEDWRWYHEPREGRPKYDWQIWRDDETVLGCTYRHELIVKAHTPDGLLSCRGVIEGYSSDISVYAAVFGPRTPQDIVDRVARTLAAIRSEDEYYALLDASEGCAMCGRPLRDEVSKLVGVGPTCAKEHRIPHSIEAANRRLELRRKILGGVQPS
jgi:hypothetical protein